MSTVHQQYRDRTSRELGLAGNHPDAIKGHLDAYEAAIAWELAEKLRALPLSGVEAGVRDSLADLVAEGLGTPAASGGAR